MPAEIKTKGWGPWKRGLYSVCSMHYHHDDNCHICQTGWWHNEWKLFISSFVYKLSPKFWRWSNGYKDR